MHYLPRDQRLFDGPARSRKAMWAILLCVFSMWMGMRLQALLDAHPEILIGMIAPFRSLAAAIWDMLCDAFHACASFIGYIKQTKSS